MDKKEHKEMSEPTVLKSSITGETKIESQYQSDMILADNQVRYVLPRAVSTVQQRHYIRQYAQKATYNPGEQITFIINSGDLFWNPMNSYLVLQCGVQAYGTDGTTANNTTIPVADARLGSAGALSLINRIIITSASGTEVVNMNYANGYYQTNLHYAYDDDYLDTVGRSMGVKAVPTYRSYGVVAPQIVAGTDLATSTTKSSAMISPPGFMFNPIMNKSTDGKYTDGASGTTSAPSQPSIAYNIVSKTADGKTAGMDSTVNTNSATIISSCGQLPLPFAPQGTYGVTSQMMAGSIVAMDPNQSYFGMLSTSPHVQTAASDSTTFCGGVQNDGSGAAATAATTSVAMQTPYSVDTSLKKRYVGASVIYQAGASQDPMDGTTGGLRKDPPHFIIPLHQLTGLFAQDKLIVPTLGASLRIDIFLENSDVALQWTGAIPSQQSARNYTITNPTIMLDTLMMSDAVSKKIFQVSSETGLDLDYTDCNNTTQTFTASAEQTLDNKIAVSRAEMAFVKTRDTIAMSSGTTACLFDSMCSTLISPVTYYQWNLGGLYLPQDNLRNLTEMYFNALYSWNKLELNGKPMSSSVSFEDFLCGGYNVIACNLERSSLIRLTGMPVSSSRTLTARMNLNLPYLPTPLGGTAGATSTILSAQRADMYLTYRCLLKIFPTKVVKRI